MPGPGPWWSARQGSNGVSCEASCCRGRWPRRPMIRQQVPTARRWLMGRRYGRREWLAERVAHRRDLLLLSGDDFLGKTEKRLVVSIAQLGFGHVNGALVMGHHHRDEVSIHIVGRLDLHRCHHPGHSSIALG